MAHLRGYNTHPSTVASFGLAALICSIMLLAELPGGNLLNLAVGAGFVAAVLAVTVLGNRSLYFGREVGLLAAWIVFSILPSFFAVDHWDAVFKLVTMLQVIVLVFCVQQVIVWQRSVSLLLMLYGIAVALAYGITFTELSLSDVADADVREGGERIASTLANQNKFGAACVMGLSLCLLSVSLNGSRWLTLFWAVLVPVLLFAAMNSGSRTALLGALVVLVGSVWAFRLWRGRVIARAIMATPLLVAVGVALMLFAQSNVLVSERIEQTFDTEGAIVTRVTEFLEFMVTGDTRAESGNSIDERTGMIKEGVSLLADNPFFGVGLDNFRHVSSAGTYSHSNPIEVSVSTGLLGLLLYYSIYAYIGWRALKLSKRSGGHALPRMALVALAGYSLMDLTHVSYYEKTSWLFLALLTATLEVFARALQQQAGAAAKRRRRRRRRHREGDSAQSDEDLADLDELGDVLGSPSAGDTDITRSGQPAS